MGPSRRQNWPTLLASYLDSNKAREFAWGAWDCVHAATGAVEAMTGLNLLGELWGAYSSQEEAALILGDHGLEERVSDVLEAFQLPEIPSSRAQRGDLVLVVLGEADLALGVVDLRGTHAAVASLSGGWAFIPIWLPCPRVCVKRAWRVG